jgi:hypothetical protein
MTAIDFPDDPEIGDRFVAGGITREYDGVAWKIVPTTITGPTGATGPQGPAEGGFVASFLFGVW